MTQPPADTAAVPVRPKLAIGVWTGLMIVLAAAAAFVQNLYRGGPEGYAVSRAAGGVVGVLLLVLIVGGVAFLVSKRSSRAANIAIVVVCLLTLISSGVQSRGRRAAEDRELLADLTTQAAQLKAEQRAEFEASGSISLEPERVNQVLDQMAQTAAKSEGEQARAVAISIEVTKRLAEVSARYTAKAEEALAAGGASGEGITSVEQIDRRIEVWLRAETLSTELLTRTEGMAAEIEAALVAEGISEKFRRGFMDGLTTGGRMELMVEVQRQEREMVRGIFDQLGVLKRAFGAWRHDAEQDAVEFDDPAHETAFTEALERLTTAQQRQTTAQERLIKLQAASRR